MSETKIPYNATTEPEIQDFKGNALICLNPGSKYPLSFGLTKAKLIYQHIDKIIAFINSDGKSLSDSNKIINNNNQADEALPY